MTSEPRATSPGPQPGHDRRADDSAACPLCLHPGTSVLYTDRARSYRACAHCGLVHVPRRHHISAPAQKRRYDLHRNDPADAGYCAFLGRLMEPLAARLAPGAQGLDFGCGPAPVLATLLSQRGFRMTHYDPFYAAHPAALTRAYDFVACSETVEHFTRPRDDWQRLFRLVRPGGWLGVMTSLLTPETDFARWRYRMDETHVCFYRSETLTWLETHHGARLHPAGPSVFLFEC